VGDLVCTPAIGDAGLIQRTAALIERDVRQYPMAVNAIVVGIDVKGEPPNDEPLPHETLLESLERDPDGANQPAAFIAGRCTTGDADADAVTLHRLQQLADSFDPAHLRYEASTYVEALLALALLGQVDTSRSRLTDLVTIPEYNSIAAASAAEALAQLGSPAGYTLLHGELHDKDDPHGRMMATRRLLAFVPYDGQVVGSLTIDVRRDLLGRLKDRDDDVAAEVPGLMLETGLDGIVDDVRAATSRPYSKAVRAAAERALAHSNGH
jgi:hypothetical protein